jgi:hypothetical protein
MPQHEDTGHYEVRTERRGRIGLEMAVIIWHPPGEPPIRVTAMVPDRLPLLAKALNEHLAGPGR